jgi:3'(2'), 5'-bisphosphate nucleotidase
MSYARELAAARLAADEASREILRLYSTFTAIPDAPADITTEADRRAQEVILDVLRGTWPDDAYCAEEATGVANLPMWGPRVWVVDPIDGSRGFARKNGEFSVMIALAVEGQPVVGVVAEPARRRLTWAVQGEGAWAEDAGCPPARCSVSAVADLRAATVTRSRSDRAPLLPEAARLIETYSAGVKLAQVARAEADVYVGLSTRFHAWDLCAGHLLVAEAGGRMTTADGRPIVYEACGTVAGVLAAPPQLHGQVLAALGGKTGKAPGRSSPPGGLL